MTDASHFAIKESSSGDSSIFYDWELKGPMMRKSILVRDQDCVLCGGRRKSTTIEHIPSTSIFTDKRRPRGLEVGACLECNSGTRNQEEVVALLSRMYPDNPLASERKFVRKLMKSTFINNPGLGQEMYADQLPVLNKLGSEAMKLPNWNFLTLGPIALGALREFGFKLGAVLHYHKTGLVLPIGGGVLVTPYTNVQAFTKGIPEKLLEIMGSGLTLKAGKWEVGAQFRFASIWLPEDKLSYHLAVFRESFALLLMASHSLHAFKEFPALDLRPV